MCPNELAVSGSHFHPERFYNLLCTYTDISGILLLCFAVAKYLLLTFFFNFPSAWLQHTSVLMFTFFGWDFSWQVWRAWIAHFALLQVEPELRSGGREWLIEVMGKLGWLVKVAITALIREDWLILLDYCHNKFVVCVCVSVYELNYPQLSQLTHTYIKKKTAALGCGAFISNKSKCCPDSTAAAGCKAWVGLSAASRRRSGGPPAAIIRLAAADNCHQTRRDGGIFALSARLCMFRSYLARLTPLLGFPFL